jgi:hypothetical protein
MNDQYVQIDSNDGKTYGITAIDLADGVPGQHPGFSAHVCEITNAETGAWRVIVDGENPEDDNVHRTARAALQWGVGQVIF